MQIYQSCCPWKQHYLTWYVLITMTITLINPFKMLVCWWCLCKNMVIKWNIDFSRNELNIYMLPIPNYSLSSSVSSDNCLIYPFLSILKFFSKIYCGHNQIGEIYFA